MAAVGFACNLIPGLPEEAKSNATDLALALGPTLTFGGVAVRASRAKWLAPSGLLVADDPKTPINERLQSVWRLAMFAACMVAALSGVAAIILWFFLR